MTDAFRYWEIFSAITILYYGIFFAVNRMSHCTSHAIRFAWVCLTVGAMAVFLWPCMSHPLLICGVSLFVVADKRRSITD